jgi:hypothetical protein
MTIVASAVLWHLGGQGHKWCRQIVGGVISLMKGIMLLNVFALIYWLALWLMVQGFSYGIKSPVHKFWVWILKKGGDGNDPMVETIVRATCGLMWSLAGLVFAFLTGNWIAFGIYAIVCTALVTVFGLSKKVQISELGTGASVALSILI